MAKICIILFIVDLCLISCINFFVSFTFFILGIFFITMTFLFFKNIKYNYLNCYLLYILFCTIIYLCNLYNINCFGFTGFNYGSTDDSYFYSRMMDYYSSYKELPINFPLRYGKKFAFYIKRDGFSFYPWLLSKFAYIIGLYKKIEPLDIIYVNALIQSFLPIFTFKLAELLYQNKKIAKTSMLLTLFSPVLIANGLVLVRDGIVATFFLGVLYYYLKKNNYLLIFMLLFLILIREESGLQAIVVLLIIYFLKQNISKKIGLIVFSVCITIILCYLYQEKILALTGGSFFYRKNFVEGFLASNGNGKNGGIYKIQQLNILLRVPLSMLAFYLSPLMSLKTIYIENVFFIRNFLYYFLYPIINLFCIGYFTKMLFFIKKDKNLQFIFFSYLFLLYFVSQFSFQIRHTTMYMPLYYILCSYGIWKQDNSNYKILKRFAVILTTILYLGINFI